jgi:hypothetical protein
MEQKNMKGSRYLDFFRRRNIGRADALAHGVTDGMEDEMRKLLVAAAAAAALFAAVPASAQVYYNDPGWAGVQVGPFGFGVGAGPRYGYGWRDHYAYSGDCRTVRERIVTASGRVIYRTHRSCD